MPDDRCALVEGIASFEALLVKVETFPPLFSRLLFGPTMPENSTLGGGTMLMMPNYFTAVVVVVVSIGVFGLSFVKVVICG